MGKESLNCKVTFIPVLRMYHTGIYSSLYSCRVLGASLCALAAVVGKQDYTVVALALAIWTSLSPRQVNPIKRLNKDQWRLKKGGKMEKKMKEKDDEGNRNAESLIL